MYLTRGVAGLSTSEYTVLLYLINAIDRKRPLAKRGSAGI